VDDRLESRIVEITPLLMRRMRAKQPLFYRKLSLG